MKTSNPFFVMKMSSNFFGAATMNNYAKIVEQERLDFYVVFICDTLQIFCPKRYKTHIHKLTPNGFRESQ